MDDLVRRWQYGWGLCRELQPATEHDGVLDVVLALPRRYREWFALGDDPSHVRDLAKKAADAAKPTWLTVTSMQRADELAGVLEEAGLEPAAERKLLMSTDLADHPAAAARPEYELTRTTTGPLELVEIRHASGEFAARGMMAVVGTDAVMHDIQTDPGHRRRGLGSVVMAALARRAVERGGRTGLLMATVEGGHLYRKLNWSPEATMLTATTRNPSALG